MAVNPIGGVTNLNPMTGTAGILSGTNETEGISKSFADFLNEAVNNTNSLLLESQEISANFAAGNTDNIHEVLIAGEKADIALQFTLQVRNKILDAYTEIMRMQI